MNKSKIMLINNDDLRKLQLIQLYIMLEIKRICDKYSISYFLTAGTLLGAVRHKGYIPWDDDTDIGMFRKDYDRFIDACKTDLSDKFTLCSKESDENWGDSCSTLMLNGTLRFADNMVNTGLHYGIDVDILVYDNSPSNIILAWFHTNFCKMLYVIYSQKCKQILTAASSSKITSRIIWNLCKIVSLFISKKATKKISDKIFTLYNSKDCKYVLSITGVYNIKREHIEKDIISDCTSIEFEGHLFKVPKYYHQFLTIMYGDYMKIPPEAERRSHPIVSGGLDFGEYSDIETRISQY